MSDTTMGGGMPVNPVMTPPGTTPTPTMPSMPVSDPAPAAPTSPVMPNMPVSDPAPAAPTSPVMPPTPTMPSMPTPITPVSDSDMGGGMPGAGNPTGPTTP